MENQIIQRPDARLQDNWAGFQKEVINNANKVLSKLWVDKNDLLHIYRTDVELSDVYLDNLPEDKQHYNCNACKMFLQRYGNLVAIKNNETIPLFWSLNSAIPFFKKSSAEMYKAVKNANIAGVFVFNEPLTSDINVFGIPSNTAHLTKFEWSHFYWPVSESLDKNLLPKAKYQERYDMLYRINQEITVETIDTAIGLINSGLVYRGNEDLPTLTALKTSISKLKSIRKNKDIAMWTMVFEGEAVYHLRSSAVYTFLKDLVTINDTDKAIENYGYKKDPTNYGRVKTEVSITQINLAKKAIGEMGLLDALKRRYARYSDLPQKAYLWANTGLPICKKQNTTDDTGFGNIKPKTKVTESKAFAGTPVTMTWNKFQHTILPDVKEMEITYKHPSRLVGLTTAEVEKSGNLFAWGNPFAWYYNGGNADGEIRKRVEEAGGQYDNVFIRCSLIWGLDEASKYTDLDLHCVTPNGSHIYYGDKHPYRANGGYLDIDANGGSHRTPKPVENIRWSKDAPTPEEGLYSFYIHNYQERGPGKTPYKIELEVNGDVHTAEGVAGGWSYRDTVFSFIYRNGEIRNMSDSVQKRITWELTTNQNAKVNAIILSPNAWEGQQIKQSHIIFLLEGCKDDSGTAKGFMPEYLRADMRPHRKVLEHYTKNNPVNELEDGNLFGLGFNQDTEWGLNVIAKTNSVTYNILIDRYE